MKKFYKSAISLMLILIIVFSLGITASAGVFNWSMKKGETLKLMLSDTPYVSNDTSIVEIQHNGGSSYTAVAVGTGVTTVTGGTWMGNKNDDYVITVTPVSWPMLSMGGFMAYFGILLIIVIIVLILGIAEMIYIFIAAPKCGMSRLWALVPLFSNTLGFIVFIVVCSQRKKRPISKTVECPTCNSVNPANAETCSICGTSLK